MTLDFGQFSMEDLIAFRDALNTYIVARQQEEAASDLEGIDKQVAAIELSLGKINQDLTQRQTEIESLKKRIGLAQNTNGYNGNHAAMPVLPSVSSPASAPAPTPEDSPEEIIRDREYMCQLLNVHRTTLARWIDIAAPFVSDACLEGGEAELTSQDEAVLKRIKELREQGLNSTQIKQRLSDEYPKSDHHA